MIAVDTNIIVRLLTQDDQTQYDAVYALLQREQFYIATTVILETEWVLRYAYKFSPEQIVVAFRALFGLPNVELGEPLQLADALTWHEQGMDFADALHLANSHTADRFVTFDKKLAARARALSDLPVEVLEPRSS